MVLRPFVLAYLAGVVVAWIIRFQQIQKYQRASKPTIPPRELLIMFVWFIASHVIPAIYCFAPILTFANYPLILPIKIVGIGVFIVALWLLRQSHVDLGRNWSPIAEIQTNQILITQGVYRYLRHPMYSAHLLWGLAQGLLISNWLVGYLGIVTFAMLYFSRIAQEERLMQEHFGQEYINYRYKVGAVIPKLFSNQNG
ncbi:protein-S-isoprenylcysteine O-methyltransferase [Vacuolonema iberomarrocanum]|uniref:protein-S-isoprenylcysteine O-methyltransferase n=1 Tax=Vacuolonema iberomarrocanum TaxID=3454632 RepID=UPI0019F576D3|nr:isoprenylcysteine carboxylmethyltransferase family protein [filamentous cyanobacterium LEGE 07170]